MRTPNLTSSSITRLVAIVAIVVALVLGVNLGRQATVVYRLRREQARLELAVAEEKARAAALQERKAYVLSDAFVEEWARTVAKLTQPGEVRVIVLDESQKHAESVGPAVDFLPAQKEADLAYWEQWWELFFGPTAHRRSSEFD
jgi:cell division protein FtsB